MPSLVTQSLRDGASAIDEKLRRWAERPILQRGNDDRSLLIRQGDCNALSGWRHPPNELRSACGNEAGENPMATEQPVVGDRYWGAQCPECGEMAAHSKAENDKPGEAQVTMICRNGHHFSARTEELLHFEWGAQ